MGSNSETDEILNLQSILPPFKCVFFHKETAGKNPGEIIHTINDFKIVKWLFCFQTGLHLSVMTTLCKRGEHL